MTIPEVEIAFRVVIPAEDCEQFEPIVSTIVETAYILPETLLEVGPDGGFVVSVGVEDEYHYRDLTDAIRDLVDEYERRLSQRD